MNRSAPNGPIVPSLIYDDLPAALAWLSGAFGFQERLRAGDSHAQMRVGEGGIMLSKSRTGQGFAGDEAALRPPRPGEVGVVLTVRVDDVDAHHAHARDFGATILQPPTDHFYGERQYTVVDLAGHRWTFTQTIQDVDPAGWALTPLGP